MEKLNIDTWYNSEVGRQLLSMEKAVVSELLTSVFGYYLVQLDGGYQFQETLQNSSVRHQFSIQSSFPKGGSIVGDSHLLPLATDSIDAIFMPHTLDFSTDYHQVLREVERVLIPEGKVIIIGFNPYSSWGLWRLLQCRKNIPWNAHFISVTRITDWLNLLGFSIDSCIYRYWGIPAKVDWMPNTLRWVSDQLKMHNVAGGGIYIIQATRQISRLTPIMPKWKKAPVLAGAVAESRITTHRENNQ